MREATGRSNRVCGVLAVALLAGCALAPPVQEMSDARQAIAAAEAAQADRWARDEISAAQRFIARAEESLAAGSFGPARTSALRAQDRAVRALQLAREAAEAEAQ